ncbi:MAG: hypothetical protein ACTH6S_11710 [Mesonia sp.]|uniref:hypothetical protein n=1 Tax=Mesonia sp. TaxID=1960830 RepID=UPI003F9E4676
MTKKKGDNRVIPNEKFKNDKLRDEKSSETHDEEYTAETSDGLEQEEQAKEEYEDTDLPPPFSLDEGIPLEDPITESRKDPEPYTNGFGDDIYNEDGRDTLEDEGPPPISINEIEHVLEYDDEFTYLFIFGPGSSGKTVLISSILYYLDNFRSVNYGDTLKNVNDPSKTPEREGNKLWKELSTTLFDNKFPRGTTKVKVSNPFPRQINAYFIPKNEKLQDFKFCLMDMAGDDLHNIDHESKEQLPDSIKAYVEQMPKNNLCFIYVLDPNSLSYEKSEQLGIFNAFIDLLDRKGHTKTPLLFLVTKWDKVEGDFENVEDYLKSEYRPIWGKLNQQARDITYTEFSIGKVNENDDKITRYNPIYAEKVFNWLYEKQTGNSLKAPQKKKKRFF